MRLLDSIFHIFTLYFIALIVGTSVRRELTFKGIFGIFIFILVILFVVLLLMWEGFLFGNGVSEFMLPLTSINWLGLDVSISLRVDTLSYFFILLVVVIGLATNVYILNYFKYEAHEDIFILLINWFIFSMIFLLLSNNLFSIFLGWESIGLSSFFLINFWSTRRGTVKSSFKAFFFNKISDIFLLLFIVLLFSATNITSLTTLSLHHSVILTNISPITNLATIFLLSCTLFKSAQLFGHLWLPDSMEAPVPASALIHSATLVSAGVYLLLRFTPLLSINNLQEAIMFIGSLTAAYGGIVASSQTDMKKLLAYSTISHCGFLFVIIGTQSYLTSIIYLFMHGLFKASTFFCAGSFIRVAGSQDTRNMGGLSRLLPVDTIFLIICSFNLGGLPYSLGYLYKSVLITALLSSSTTYLILGFCTIGLSCSIIYVYRLVYYSAFDISKEFFPLYIYELQQKQQNVVKYWSLSTYVQTISICIIFVFTLWIYPLFINLFLHSDIMFNTNPLLLVSNTSQIATSNYLYKYYYEMFYSLYVLVCVIIGVVTWRLEYTASYKLSIQVFTLLILIFGILLDSFGFF